MAGRQDHFLLGDDGVQEGVVGELVEHGDLLEAVCKANERRPIRAVASRIESCIVLAGPHAESCACSIEAHEWDQHGV